MSIAATSQLSSAMASTPPLRSEVRSLLRE